MSIRRPLLLLLALASLLALGGCNNDSKVGSDKLKNFESQKGEGALGGTTTTAAPAATTAPPQATAKPAATTAPKAVATTQAPVQTTAAPPTTAAASITIKIQGDNQGNAFEPANTRAYAGSTIRFQNVDSASHQVRGRNNEFQSPNLAPGATWDFKINLAPGTYEYTDSARPYAVGYLEVLAR